MAPLKKPIISSEKPARESKGISRRELLKGGAAIGALALVSACTREGPTTTITNSVTNTKTVTSTLTSTTTVMPTVSPAVEVYTFFNQTEAETVKAIFAQLMPGSPQDPGAVEAGAHIFTDRALAGFYSSQQTTYRRGLAAVNAFSQSKYSNNFSGLTAAQKIEVLSNMQAGTATGFNAPAAAVFFNLLNQHVREGTFCDPVYEGNNNLAGWKMIGFPGAQITYDEQDMVPGANQANKNILILADMEGVPMPMPDSGF